MARASRIAKDDVLLGSHGVIPAGQEIPETYLDSLNEEQKTDFDRLEELGLLGEPEAIEAPDPVAGDDLSDLKKDQLLELAAAEGVEVDPKATKAVIAAAIEQHRQS